MVVNEDFPSILGACEFLFSVLQFITFMIIFGAQIILSFTPLNLFLCSFDMAPLSTFLFSGTGFCYEGRLEKKEQNRKYLCITHNKDKYYLGELLFLLETMYSELCVNSLSVFHGQKGLKALVGRAVIYFCSSTVLNLPLCNVISWARSQRGC